MERHNSYGINLQGLLQPNRSDITETINIFKHLWIKLGISKNKFV